MRHRSRPDRRSSRSRRRQRPRRYTPDIGWATWTTARHARSQSVEPGWTFDPDPVRGIAETECAREIEQPQAARAVVEAAIREDDLACEDVLRREAEIWAALSPEEREQRESEYHAFLVAVWRRRQARKAAYRRLLDRIATRLATVEHRVATRVVGEFIRRPELRVKKPAPPLAVDAAGEPPGVDQPDQRQARPRARTARRRRGIPRRARASDDPAGDGDPEPADGRPGRRRHDTSGKAQ